MIAIRHPIFVAYRDRGPVAWTGRSTWRARQPSHPRIWKPDDLKETAMETLLALAPLLICPLMMVLMGGGIARALKRVGRRAPKEHRIPATAGGQRDG
jgi:hypothetical protein